jgi:hypothetical protein
MPSKGLHCGSLLLVAAVLAFPVAIRAGSSSDTLENSGFSVSGPEEKISQATTTNHRLLVAPTNHRALAARWTHHVRNWNPCVPRMRDDEVAEAATRALRPRPNIRAAPSPIRVILVRI